MTKKKEEVPGPSKAKIEYLLRHGCFMNNRYDDHGDPDYQEYRKLANEYDQRVKEFEEGAPMKRLAQHRDERERAWSIRRKKFEERLTKIRREFYARGMTPKVLKDIGQYIDDLNEASV